MAAAKTQHLSSTAQQYLEIFDITNDLLILRDGSTALVLKVNAINFGLLSEPEQDAIIYAYAALINSLSFPIQIVIQSKPKDVSNYLEYLDEQATKTDNPLRRQQIALYRNFVANLITEQNVLDKSFYVVLPLSALELGLAQAVNPLSDIVKTNKPIVFDKHYVVEKSLNVLIPRRNHMMSQFGRLGLQAKHLTTKELIHSFYTAYNAEASEGIKVVDTKEYTSAVIQARQGGNQNEPEFVDSTTMAYGTTASVPTKSAALAGDVPAEPTPESTPTAPANAPPPAANPAPMTEAAPIPPQPVTPTLVPTPAATLSQPPVAPLPPMTPPLTATPIPAVPQEQVAMPPTPVAPPALTATPIPQETFTMTQPR